MLHYQKQRIGPELREHPLLSVALAVANKEHWNITNNPIYPACLADFRKRHRASQARKLGAGTKTPPATASSLSPASPALSEQEVMTHVRDILDRVHALHHA